MRKKRKTEVIDGGVGVDRKKDLIALQPAKALEAIEDGGTAGDRRDFVIIEKIKGLFRTLHLLLILLFLLAAFSAVYDISAIPGRLPETGGSHYINPFRSSELLFVFKDLLLIIVLVLVGKVTRFPSGL